MSCISGEFITDGSEVNGSWPRCPASELLPCFLMFTNYVIPQRDGSNQACPLVVRRSTDEAVVKCSGEQPSQLGSQAYLLHEASSTDVPIEQQRWQLDAKYFQYQGCICLTVCHHTSSAVVSTVQYKRSTERKRNACMDICASVAVPLALSRLPAMCSPSACLSTAVARLVGAAASLERALLAC